MSWILVNLFLILLVLIGAGYLWLFGTLIKWMRLNETVENYGLGIAALAALFATYYTMKFLYELIDRRMRSKA